MQTAKLFKNGESQAVRLPKAFRMPGSEVRIRKDGRKVILEPIEKGWNPMWSALEQLPADFAIEREQPAMQTREEIKLDRQNKKRRS